jgi:hypothetical protein
MQNIRTFGIRAVPGASLHVFRGATPEIRIDNFFGADLNT